MKKARILANEIISETPKIPSLLIDDIKKEMKDFLLEKSNIDEND